MAVPSGSENKEIAPTVEKPKSTGVAALYVIIFGIMLALVFGGKSSNSGQGSVLAPIVLGIVAFGFLSYACFQLFFLPQTRLAEWLATVVVCGTITTVGREILLNRNRDFDSLPTFIGVTMAISFLSSGFGWQCAERLNERQPNARWRILAAYWIAAMGVAILGATLTGVAGQTLYGEEAEWWPVIGFGTIVVSAILLTPAVLEEMRARRYEREHPKNAKLPEGPSTADERFIFIFSVLLMPLLFVFAPYFWRKGRNRLKASFRILSETEVSDKDRAFIDSFNPLMDRLGFTPLGFGGDTISELNASTVVHFWTNGAGTFASVYCIHVPNAETRSLHPEFLSYCDNGTLLQTVVGLMFSDYQSTVRVLSVNESLGYESMLAIHVKRLRNFESDGQEKARIELSMDDLATEINRRYEADRTLELERGYAKIIPAGDQIKPTWLGAYRGFFITMPPFKQIREARERRRMNAEVEALGF